MSRIQSQALPVVSPGALNELAAEPVARQVNPSSVGVDQTAAELLGVLQAAGQAGGALASYNRQRAWDARMAQRDKDDAARDAERKRWEKYKATVTTQEANIYRLDPEDPNYEAKLAAEVNALEALSDSQDFSGTLYEADQSEVKATIAARHRAKVTDVINDQKKEAALGLEASISQSMRTVAFDLAVDNLKNLTDTYAEIGDASEMRDYVRDQFLQSFSQNEQDLITSNTPNGRRLAEQLEQSTDSVMDTIIRTQAKTEALANSKTHNFFISNSVDDVIFGEKTLDEIFATAEAEGLELDPQVIYDRISAEIVTQVGNRDLDNAGRLKILSAIVDLDSHPIAGTPASKRTMDALRVLFDDYSEEIISTGDTFPSFADAAKDYNRLYTEGFLKYEDAARVLMNPTERAIYDKETDIDKKMAILSENSKTAPLMRRFQDQYVNKFLKDHKPDNTSKEGQGIANTYAGREFVTSSKLLSTAIRQGKWGVVRDAGRYITTNEDPTLLRNTFQAVTQFEQLMANPPIDPMEREQAMERVTNLMFYAEPERMSGSALGKADLSLIDNAEAQNFGMIMARIFGIVHNNDVLGYSIALSSSGRAAQRDALFQVLSDFRDVDWVENTDPEVTSAAFTRYRDYVTRQRGLYDNTGVFGDNETKKKALDSFRWEGRPLSLSAKSVLSNAVPMPVDDGLEPKDIIRVGISRMEQLGWSIYRTSNDEVGFVKDNVGATFHSFGIDEKKLNDNWRTSPQLTKRLAELFTGDPEGDVYKAIGERWGYVTGEPELADSIATQLKDGTVELRFTTADPTSDRPMAQLRIVGKIDGIEDNRPIAEFNWGEAIGPVHITRGSVSGQVNALGIGIGVVTSPILRNQMLRDLFPVDEMIMFGSNVLKTTTGGGF